MCFEKIILNILLVTLLVFKVAISSQDMIIRLNGHAYQVENLFSKKVEEVYEKIKMN